MDFSSILERYRPFNNITTNLKRYKRFLLKPSILKYKLNKYNKDYRHLLRLQKNRFKNRNK